MRKPAWAAWPDEKILDLRLRDLGVKIQPRSELGRRIAQLERELAQRNIKFRPYFYLSDEWFCPDGTAGIAVPFYLAHPRLQRLELRQMLEVEGGSHGWCMRILRHEAGHAIENAYGLRRQKDRQRIFGKSSKKYPTWYTPRPYSKSFVLHLDPWYAQSHPTEDFAETFAVWLNPRSQWRRRYAGWPALEKLQYVDDLVQDLAGKRPRTGRRLQVDALPTLRRTLREHYASRQKAYRRERPDFYDRDLLRLFSDQAEHRRNRTAASFLRSARSEARREVAKWTAAYQYMIDQVLEDMIARCRELKLRVRGPGDPTIMDVTILLTVQTMNYLHSGRHRVAL